MADNKNLWLELLLNGLKQHKYNLTKNGLYIGQIKVHMEALIEILVEDYEIK